MSIGFADFILWLKSKWSSEFSNPKYYGKILITIEAGNITRIEPTQSIKEL